MTIGSLEEVVPQVAEITDSALPAVTIESGQRAARHESVAALADLAHRSETDPQRRAARDRVICEYMSLARGLALRFAGRGEPVDDLIQVATIGLIKAVDRFDAERGASFVGFATPTILGELRRHFRDTAWDMHVSRRLQELHLEINKVTAELTQQLGRSVTAEDIAERLGVTVAEVCNAQACGTAYNVRSLNTTVLSDGDGDTETELGDLIGTTDTDLDSFADRHSVLQLLAGLPERDQRVLSLRFYEGMTQTQIAEQLGVSQMQISRLLSAALRKLRDALLADDAE
jgi:RNA polymerase sigma-B factor